MSRNISNGFLNELQRQDIDDPILALLTISHATLDEPIRVVNNTENIVSNGETFLAFPFELKLPDDFGDRSSRGTLEIDNISRDIVQSIEAMGSKPATVLIEVIMASQPDVIEMQFPDYRLSNVSWDRYVVRGDLEIEDLTRAKFPRKNFTPDIVPGMH